MSSLLDSYRPKINVADFLGVGEVVDGVTDNTAAVARAYAAISSTLGGELYFTPENWKFNLVVLKHNVIITGQSHYRDGFAATVNMRSRFVPADITKPVIQVGNDTDYVRGVAIQNVTLYGANTGSTGLYFAGGAFEATVDNCAVTLFTTCIKVQGGTNYPASIIRFTNVDGQPANVAGARGWYIANTANYPTSWTTEVNLTNCHWDGPASASNSYVMEVDSTEIKLVNCYFDVHDAHGIKISKSLTPSPWIDAVNSNVDSGLSTNVAVEGYNNGRRFSGLASLNFQIYGKYKELDGTLMQPPPNHFRQDTFLVYPTIYGELNFCDPTDATWLGGTYNKYRIYAGASIMYFDTTNGLGQEKHLLGSGIFYLQNTNPTPDGNVYIRCFDNVNSKQSDINFLNGSIQLRPANGSATRLQSFNGGVTGLQVNGADGAVFMLGPSLTANTNLYLDVNRQLISASVTITAPGTTGARTINKNFGRVNFAAAAQTLVVTNSLVTTSSIITATMKSDDTTAKSVIVSAQSAGSFTLKLNAAATAETAVDFAIFNGA